MAASGTVQLRRDMPLISMYVIHIGRLKICVSVWVLTSRHKYEPFFKGCNTCTKPGHQGLCQHSLLTSFVI